MTRALTLVLLLFCATALAATEFELPDLEGEIHRLSDYRGQWVVVNYWATWCAPCRKEIPDLSELHDRRDDVTVLGLAYEDTDVETWEKFLEEYSTAYPILQVDVYDPPEALGPPLALPTTFMVSPDGELAHTWVGPITGAMVEEWIAEAESDR